MTKNGEPRHSVYIASSLRNYKANLVIAQTLEDMGIACFLPQRDATERKLQEARKSGNGVEASLAREIRRANIDAIRSASVVVVLADHVGRDTAWECGFATALEKPLLLIVSRGDLAGRESLQETYMLFYSLDEEAIKEIPNYNRETLQSLLRTEFASQVWREILSNGSVVRVR